MNERSALRRLLHALLLVPTLLTAAAIGWVRLSDPFGDVGMTNAISAVLALVGGFFFYSWFVTARGIPARVRRTFGGGALLVVALFVLFVRIDGVTGYLKPELSWRFAPREAHEAQPEAPSAGVDLATTTPTDFPGFFGADRNGRVRDVALARDWRAFPPEELWRAEVGEGWSAFALVNGIAVTQEQWGADEAVTAYGLTDGSLLWAQREPGDFEHFLGGNGPRATPTIDGGRVYALGATGRFLCLDGRDGQRLWEKDLLAEYGLTPAREAELIAYGRANSPLIVDDLVVIPAGGEPTARQAGLVAYDKVTGELRWESPARQASFSSPALVNLAGRRQLLIVNESSVTGHDPADGAILWEFAWPGTSSANASSSQAQACGDDRVLVSKGYGVGAAVHRIVPTEDGGLRTELLWENKRVLRTKYTNVVLHGGHAYALSDGILACVSLETGERIWREGRYGHGQVLLVGELLLVLGEEGELVLIDPSPERPNEVLGEIQALAGKTWNHLALSGDLLALRNGREAVVYRLALASAR